MTAMRNEIFSAQEDESNEKSPAVGQEFATIEAFRQWASQAEVKTLPQLIRRTVDRFGDRPYLGVRVGEVFKFETYNEIYAKILYFASALLEIGCRPGERIANFSNNRPEWAVVDFGTAHAACIHVPMYATLSQSEMAYIVKDSAASVVIAASEDHLRKVVAIADECPHLKHIIAIAPNRCSSSKQLWNWNEFLDFGRVHLTRHMNAIEHLVATLKPEDVSSIVYTSGTTGDPKGAMLMHGNFCSQAVSLQPLIQADENDVQLSFLPLAHVFERVIYYIMSLSGGSIGYTAGLMTLMQDLPVLRPMLLTSVPVLYGKVYDRAMARSGGIRRQPLKWVMNVGRNYRVAQRAGRVNKGLRALQSVGRKMLFSNIMKKSGGRVRYFISGGAPLRPEVCEFFCNIGMPILEGYGLTETSPVLTLNPCDAPRPGSVGKAVPGVEVVVDDEGEILARGPNIMRGYYKQKDETASVINEEGWFHTGDIGHLDDGYLFITDRKKNLLVLSNGKNVAPSAIEQSIVASPWINRVMLVGNNLPCVGALVVPDFEKLTAWAQEENLHMTLEELLRSDRVWQIITAEIREATLELSNYEKIKRICVLNRDFSVADGELTHSMKPKRRVIEEHFAKEIKAMYSNSTDN